MLRISLSICLMLISLAGQLFCPCAVVHSLRTVTWGANESAALSCSCCDLVGQLGLTKRHSPRTPAHSPCSCPAHGHRVIAVMPHRVQLDHSWAPATFDLLQFALQPCSPQFTWSWTSGEVARANATTSLLSPSDRLHMICLLLC